MEYSYKFRIYPNAKQETLLQKLARLQRQLSRKSKGSNRREKARVRVARLQERIANQRQDMLHKLSTSLVRDYDLIAIEDLAPKNMVKNHKLARSIFGRKLGGVPAATEVQGCVVRETGGHSRPLLPVLPALLCLRRTVARHKGPGCPGVDLPCLRHGTRQRPQRCTKHLGGRSAPAGVAYAYSRAGHARTYTLGDTV